MSTADEHRKRIRAIMEDAPWERSKTVQKKMERELRAEARKDREPPDRPFEWAEQKVVCKWMTKRHIKFFAPSAEAGGGDVDPVRMEQFKSIGMRPGVPDLILVTLAPNGSPTVLEMKRTRLTEKALTPNQKKWQGIFIEEKWNHLVGIGAEDAIAKLKLLGY